MAEQVKTGIQIKNVDAFKQVVAQKIAVIEQANERIVRVGAEVVKSRAQDEFIVGATGEYTSKTGHVYFDNKPPHEPKPPNPTNRTGNLQRSIEVFVSKLGAGTWSASIGPTLFYGKILELGEGHLKAKYPFMANGFEKSREDLVKIYNEEWKRAIYGNG